MIQERSSLHGGGWFALDPSDQGFEIDGLWRNEFRPVRLVMPELGDELVDVPTVNHPLPVLPVRPAQATIATEDPVIRATPSGFDPTKQTLKADFSFEWTLPVEWFRWFSYPSSAIYRVEFFLGVAPGQSQPPTWELDVSSWLNKAILSAATVTASQDGYKAKWLVSGLASFQGIAPKVKLSASVSELNYGYIKRSQIYLYLDGNAAGSYLDVRKAGDTNSECDVDTSQGGGTQLFV